VIGAVPGCPLVFMLWSCNTAVGGRDLQRSVLR
jgi:hypothetical protein